MTDKVNRKQSKIGLQNQTQIKMDLQNFSASSC